MAIRAMVMAAGAGTRLHPLTTSVPKPMVPVANRPVLEYTIANLRRHGITDLVLNLHSHPQLIRNHFKSGERWGVRIRYSYEPELLGTAGGVKKVSAFLKGGTFLVMSGDGLSDINLTQLQEFHHQRHAVGTMALKPIDARFEYGVTLTNPQGRITRFIEKPKWSDVFSNHVNTGIYVFEPSILSQIPPKKRYDFGNDLWPRLLKIRSRIYGHVIDAYWCDVGNLSEYRRAHKDVLDGKLRLPFPGRLVRPHVWVDEGTVIERGVTLEAPCLIGKNTRIERGARIGAYTVIGNGVRIGRNANLRNCILWNNVKVENRVRLENCVIGHSASVAENISVYEGAVINISG
jgi:mannose-1-phosphate guanylyltransferase/phosphomannomutase